MSKPLEMRYLPSARRDIIEILEYIQLDNPEIAMATIERFDNEIGKLADFPLLGKSPNNQRLLQLGYRILIVGNYLVFYVVCDLDLSRPLK
ncbi:type II toxin-antitoxin system RelE/ParE family toxin [Peptococcaceae bacterium 1198_IL3148]